MGLFAGILSGLFGIGGALITTPALRLVMRAPALIALGTTLPAVIPTALAGAVIYRKAGQLDSEVAFLVAPYGILGALGGATATAWASGSALMLATAALVAAAAFWLLRNPSAAGVSSPEGHGPEPALPRSPVPWSPFGRRCLAIGLAAGGLSGLLGLGGGLILVPAFVLLLHLPMRTALGTSLLAIVVLAVPGTVVHACLGHVDWVLAAGLAAGGAIAGCLGARLAIRATDAALRTAMSVFLLCVAAAYAANEVVMMLSGQR